MEEITKQEFCQATHSKPNGWLWEYEADYPIRLYKEIKGEQVYYHFEEVSPRGCEHRIFKDMPEYGEVWSGLIKPYRSGLWSTWAVY